VVSLPVDAVTAPIPDPDHELSEDSRI